jgi:hypothetical protein
MSSVPVQFLIHVLSQPKCSKLPSIIPLTDCLEVQVDTLVSLTLYAINYCDQTQSILTDISLPVRISSMNISQLQNSTQNTSLSYITLKWITQNNQIGQQQFCATAYTKLTFVFL